MMRLIKSRGGITQGRGVTESVLTMWINTAHRCSTIHDAVRNLTDHKHRISHQHIEMVKSRMEKDIETMKKIQQ